jgi:hypothetical protein
MARLYSSKKRLDWAATVMGSIGLCGTCSFAARIAQAAVNDSTEE